MSAVATYYATYSSVLCVFVYSGVIVSSLFFFFFQAEDGIRDLVRSRGLGDVYKRQASPASTRPREPVQRAACRPAAPTDYMPARTHRRLSLIHI